MARESEDSEMEAGCGPGRMRERSNDAGQNNTERGRQSQLKARGVDVIREGSVERARKIFEKEMNIGATTSGLIMPKTYNNGPVHSTTRSATSPGGEKLRERDEENEEINDGIISGGGTDFVYGAQKNQERPGKDGSSTAASSATSSSASSVGPAVTSSSSAMFSSLFNFRTKAVSKEPQPVISSCTAQQEQEEENLLTRTPVQHQSVRKNKTLDDPVTARSARYETPGGTTSRRTSEEGGGFRSLLPSGSRIDFQTPLPDGAVELVFLIFRKCFQKHKTKSHLKLVSLLLARLCPPCCNAKDNSRSLRPIDTTNTMK